MRTQNRTSCSKSSVSLVNPKHFVLLTHGTSQSSLSRRFLLPARRSNTSGNNKTGQSVSQQTKWEFNHFRKDYYSWRGERGCCASLLLAKTAVLLYLRSRAEREEQLRSLGRHVDGAWYGRYPVIGLLIHFIHGLVMFPEGSGILLRSSWCRYRVRV